VVKVGMSKIRFIAPPLTARISWGDDWWWELGHLRVVQ